MYTWAEIAGCDHAISKRHGVLQEGEDVREGSVFGFGRKGEG